jgi:hypothetical protein
VGVAYRRHLAPIVAERPVPSAPRVEPARRTRTRTRVREVPVSWIGVALVTVFTALISAVAADARWLAALGHEIVVRGGIPDGVPFASAPTKGWPNVPALAELTFNALYSVAGARGLQIAQVVAVLIACSCMALDARRLGAGDRSTIFALLLVIPAAFASIVAIRSQLFSLALFPLLAVILRAEARRPSRLIWTIPPLLALWSNLHGAALTGLAVAAAYLVIDRARREPLVAVSVLVCSCLALCLTPALQHTPAYYAGAVGGEAARQGIGLWAPFSFSSGPDLVTLACLALAAFPLVRARPRAWELVALAGLVVLAARTSRGGVWVVLLAVPLVAAGLPWRDLRRSRVVGMLLGVCAIVAALGIVHGPFNTAASAPLVTRAVADAHGTPVLAEDALAEQVALAGGRIWVGNPVDAFSRADQRLWIAWLMGRPSGDAALAHAPRVVFVRRAGKAAARLAHDPHFRLQAEDAVAAIYLRRP